VRNHHRCPTLNEKSPPQINQEKKHFHQLPQIHQTQEP
jgi:hypothetical protein